MQSDLLDALFGENSSSTIGHQPAHHQARMAAFRPSDCFPERIKTAIHICERDRHFASKSLKIGAFSPFRPPFCLKTPEKPPNWPSAKPHRALRPAVASPRPCCRPLRPQRRSSWLSAHDRHRPRAIAAPDHGRSSFWWKKSWTKVILKLWTKAILRIAIERGHFAGRRYYGRRPFCYGLMNRPILV